MIANNMEKINFKIKNNFIYTDLYIYIESIKFYFFRILIRSLISI